MKTMTEEIWKDIIGWEGKYQVSNMGQVASFHNGRHSYTSTSRIMKPKLSGNQKRKQVLLVDDKQSTRFYVYRLVANHFVPNPDKYHEVDHVDGDVQNDAASNLRWATRQLNNLNTKLSANNKSGVKGVHYDQLGQWVASWQESGRTHHKRFKTKEEAIKFREEMVKVHYDADFYVANR